MIYKKIRNLLIIVAIGILVLGCSNFNYPSEDELDLIEWHVTKVYSTVNYHGLAINVHYTDTTNLEKDVSGEYFYDFDMTQPVKLSDLVLVDGKPLNQSYQVDEEYMNTNGGGEIILSSPVDSNSLPSISFDTSTIFYWKSDEISEVMGSNIDEYIWAKVRFATESI